VTTPNSDTASVDAILDYWDVSDIDQPIGIVPFPCGRYVCPNHGEDAGESEPMCEPWVA
jgi:hypothetical protein